MLKFTPRGQRNKLGYPNPPKYWARFERSEYSFVNDLTGARLPSTSRYMPHQGERECARRRKAMGI